MRKVYSTSDLQKIHILRSVLEGHGIACTVQGEPLLTLAWGRPR